MSRFWHHTIRDNADGAEVRLHESETGIVLCFADEGPGIAGKDLAVIARPFVRGEESRSPETGGAGLGLAIVERAVSANGGEIRFENRDPRGLAVTLSFRKS